jgi:anti-sigma-K factor RskA
MSNDHARWDDFAGAYVLGAMAVAEREAFEEHLTTCAACREEVEELMPAAEALPMASPLMVPPPALKDRIMVEVEREASLLGAAGAGADRPERVERRRRGAGWLSGWRLAPVAAALLIAGVLVGSSLGGSEQRTISATVDAPRASAELEVDGDKAILVAENLPAPPEGKVYEVWLMPEGSETPEPTNVLFTPRSDGSAEAAIPSVDGYRQVLVTDEPSGGRDAPSGTVIISAELS